MMIEKISGKELISILPSKFSMYVYKIKNKETRKIPINMFLVASFQYCASISVMGRLFEWGKPFDLLKK